VGNDNDELIPCRQNRKFFSLNSHTTELEIFIKKGSNLLKAWLPNQHRCCSSSACRNHETSQEERAATKELTKIIPGFQYLCFWVIPDELLAMENFRKFYGIRCSVDRPKPEKKHSILIRFWNKAWKESNVCSILDYY